MGEVMGFMSTVMILNDAIGEIRDHPKEFSETLYRQLMRGPDYGRYTNEVGKTPETFGFRGYSNYFSVMTQHHADVTSLILVGGNYATVLGNVYTFNRGHHEREEVKKTLNEILSQYNLKVIESPGKKK
jgi:hypothetical protein